jgi:hypothetical protein
MSQVESSIRVNIITWYHVYGIKQLFNLYGVFRSSSQRARWNVILFEINVPLYVGQFDKMQGGQ